MAIRSGRFSAETPASGTTVINIINGHGGTYRIFNSGDDSFDVYDGASKVESVPKECAIDIHPSGIISIRSTKAIDGIYDFLTENAKVRSGRFKLNAGTLQIVEKGKGGGFYRILNSGDKSVFSVKRGADPAVTVKPKMTLDFELKQSDELKVISVARVEGIFDHLDHNNEVKSGRFKIDPNVPPNPDPRNAHTIISTNNVGDAYYRIYNSGVFPFLVVGIGNSSIEIQPKDSYDFKVSKAKKAITVMAKTYQGPIASQRDPIEGIYEFVGDH